jgi:hypothetical protein
LRSFIACGRSALIVGGLAMAASTFAMGQAHDHGTADASSSSKLVKIVRDVTRRYVDVNVATSDGYIPLFGCVSGPDHGAMGIHYINPNLVGDGLIDVNPEAIIYEPTTGGLKLVGVEYIVDSKTWLDNNPAPLCWKIRHSRLLAVPTAMAWRPSSSSMSGRGAIIRMAHSLIGTTA